MSTIIKKTVSQFTKQHGITAVNYSTLRDAVKKTGFTIVEFNNIFNDKDVETIIHNLELDELTRRSRGFTYADNNYRLIFINEDLSDDEKMLVLSHELGHIACEHYTKGPVIGRDVKEEHEANEFSHYLLKQPKLKVAIAKHKKAVVAVYIAFAVILAAVIFGMVLNREQSYYGEFYISPAGNKYHQSECVHIKNNNNVERLTKEQFETGEYMPCGTCLPQG